MGAMLLIEQQIEKAKSHLLVALGQAAYAEVSMNVISISQIFILALYMESNNVCLITRYLIGKHLQVL